MYAPAASFAQCVLLRLPHANCSTQHHLKMKVSTSLPLALGLAAAATAGAFAPARSSTRSSVASLAATLEGRQIAEGGALKPVNNFVLVKVAEIQDKTESGILLTGSVSFGIYHL